MGDPSLAETAFGPLADKKQFERVMQFLEDGKKEGVQVLTGGERLGDKGTFVKPTVLLNPDLKSKVYTDEIFGPVISVITFKTEEDAVRLANDTQYGLGSTIYTSDIARALRIAGQIEAGTVGINSAFAVSISPSLLTLLIAKDVAANSIRGAQAVGLWQRERN